MYGIFCDSTELHIINELLTMKQKTTQQVKNKSKKKTKENKMSTKIVTLVKHSVITGSVYGTIEVPEEIIYQERIDEKTLIEKHNQAKMKNTNAAIRQRTQHK